MPWWCMDSMMAPRPLCLFLLWRPLLLELELELELLELELELELEPELELVVVVAASCNNDVVTLGLLTNTRPTSFFGI